MSCCSTSYVDLLLIGDVEKRASHELGAIVCDDCIHDLITVHDFFDELGRYFQASHGYGLSLDLVGELVNHDEHVIKAPRSG